MADEEWLRFQAELAAVEQQRGDNGKPQEDAPALAPPTTLSPLVKPPVTRPPPSAVAQAPPVVTKPPVAAPPPQGPQFSAPPAAAPALPPVASAVNMGGQGFAGQPGGYGHQGGMMQQGMGMGMSGMGMGMGMGGMPMGGMGMGGPGGMGMGMGGMGMGMGMQQQQQQQVNAGAGGSNPGAAKQQQPGGKKKVLLREAGGQKWVDPSLNEWPDNDFRIFVGDLGNEVTDDLLAKSFSKYSSFAKAKIVRDARTKKSKGYGFVSFLDGNDFAKALREMDGKYIGNRPCKLSKSNWDERTVRKVTMRDPPAKKQKR